MTIETLVPDDLLTDLNPVDRGKPGSTYHLLVDRRGVPLAVHLACALICLKASNQIKVSKYALACVLTLGLSRAYWMRTLARTRPSALPRRRGTTPSG